MHTQERPAFVGVGDLPFSRFAYWTVSNGNIQQYCIITNEPPQLSMLGLNMVKQIVIFL